LATVKDDPEEFPGLRHHRSRRRRPPSSRRRTTQTSSLGCAKPRWSPSWRRTPSPKRGARRTTASKTAIRVPRLVYPPKFGFTPPDTARGPRICVKVWWKL
jgi:hypothetical protein